VPHLILPARGRLCVTQITRDGDPRSGVIF